MKINRIKSSKESVAKENQRKHFQLIPVRYGFIFFLFLKSGSNFIGPI